ncbi:hypothetical protein D9M72_497400 [compost metagenome]
MLAHRLLVFLAQVGIAVAHDLAQLHLGQFFGQRVVLVEQTAFQGSLVLDEPGDDLVQVLAADARRFGGLGHSQSVDLHVDLAGLGIHAHVGLVFLVAAFAIVESVLRTLVLRRELKTRRQHLLHQQAGGDRLQGVVHRVHHRRLVRGRLGDEVGEARALFARRVAGGPADDLHDFGQTAAVADSQGVLAPDPVEPFLGHP